MRADTKEMIRNEFIKELNQKPLNKITVTGLVEACQINRNTFYYYYSDIYNILEEQLKAEVEAIIRAYDRSASWEDSFKLATHRILENRKAVEHIYYSVRREDLEQYLLRVSTAIMQRFVISLMPDTAALPSDRQLIAQFYSCALTEIMLQWVANGMKEDPDQIIDRIGYLMNGSIEEALRRSAQ